MSHQQSNDRADVQSSGPIARPLTLRLAVTGMWIGAALAAVNVVVAYVEKIATNRALYEDYGGNEVVMNRLVHTDVWQAVGIAAAFAFVEIALWTTMALTNRRGFKWARIVATALGIGGFLLALGDLVTSAIYEPVVAVSAAHSIVTQIVSIAILVLLWLPGSSSYYQTRTLERTQRVFTGATSAS